MRVRFVDSKPQIVLHLLIEVLPLLSVVEVNLKFKVFKGSKVQALYFAPTISLDFISLMKFIMAAESFLLSA